MQISFHICGVKNAPEHGIIQQRHSLQRELSFSWASLSLDQFVAIVQQSHIPQLQSGRAEQPCIQR